MAARIGIDPEEQVVLIGLGAYSIVQIAGLESAFEDDIALDFGVHPMERHFVQWLKLSVEFSEEGFQMRVIGGQQMPELVSIVSG